MTNQRDFKGVWIPKEVWLDARLNMLEKGILTEIDSLDMSESGCFASNRHIAEFCQCSETKVSTAISKLIELGYIYVKHFDGRQRILKSRLSNFERQILKKSKADIKDLKESNTDNNTSNNTSKKDIGEEPKRKRFVPPTLEEVKAYCIERKNNVDAERFIDYYTSNGWQVGKNKMKDWKAAVRTWERNGYSDKGTQSANSSFETDEFFNKALKRSGTVMRECVSPRTEIEREAIRRTEKNAQNPPKTAAEDEELMARMERLKELLGK